VRAKQRSLLAIFGEIFGNGIWIFVNHAPESTATQLPIVLKYGTLTSLSSRAHVNTFTNCLLLGYALGLKYFGEIWITSTMPVYRILKLFSTNPIKISNRE